MLPLPALGAAGAAFVLLLTIRWLLGRTNARQNA